MKRPYEAIENVSLCDLEDAKKCEGVIDKKHMNKVIDDVFYNFNFKNRDYGDILLLRDMFERGYIAAHVEITRDAFRDSYPDEFNYPYYRDENE